MRWQKKEKDDAKRFSSSRTKASGSLWYEPGDHKDDIFLYDSKDTKTKGYRITKQIWDKLQDEANFSDRTPVLSIRVEDLDLVVLSADDWEKIASGFSSYLKGERRPVKKGDRLNVTDA